MLLLLIKYIIGFGFVFSLHPTQLGRYYTDSLEEKGLEKEAIIHKMHESRKRSTRDRINYQ